MIEKAEDENAKKRAIVSAEICTNSSLMALETMHELTDRKFDTEIAHENIGREVKKASEGDLSGIENMLTAQVMTLDAIFNKIMQRALKTDHAEGLRFYMDVAMKAQNQCRKTSLALSSLKNPHQQTVVKQQNIAVNQQVNNSLSSQTKKIKPENELLEEKSNEWMDAGAERAAIEINSQLEAMGVGRSEDGRR